MKKLLIAVFLLTASFCKSQNYIDYSRREIMTEFDRKGDSYSFHTSDYGQLFMSISDRSLGTYKFYYFTDGNVCNMYMIIYTDWTYSSLTSGLDKEYSKSGNKWYSQNSEIEVNYNSKVGGYEVVFTKRGTN